MKTENKIFIFVIITIIGVMFIFTSALLMIGYYNETQGKKVSFPEEIEIANKGDLLKVERVTKDSIYLGFAKY